MKHSYYLQKQYIAKVDRKGNIIGQIEKWEAHRKGILHKAFTIAVFYKGDILLQHRKHPAFDGVFDATISSHQLIKDGKLEDTIKASEKTLKRLKGWKKLYDRIGIINENYCNPEVNYLSCILIGITFTEMGLIKI